MKFFLVILTTLFLSGSTFGQDSPSLHSQLESLIKVNRTGKGNGTFTISAPKLQAIKKTGSLKSIEAQLADWQSFASENSLGYEWNDKTRKHDVPLFQVKYETTVKSRYTVVKATALNKIDGRIKDITVTIEMNGMELAKFKKSLQDNGYLINENLTEIFKKQTWQKDGSPTFTIRKNANGTISIGIFE